MEHNRRRTDILEDLSDHDLLIRHSGKIDSVCEAIHTQGKERAAFYKKFDDFIAPDGPFMVVKTFQAACPSKSLWNNIKLQWTVIVIILGVMLKSLWGGEA